MNVYLPSLSMASISSRIPSVSIWQYSVAGILMTSWRQVFIFSRLAPFNNALNVLLFTNFLKKNGDVSVVYSKQRFSLVSRRAQVGCGEVNDHQVVRVRYMCTSTG